MQDDYMGECIAAGITSLDDIVVSAKKEIEDIKAYLHEADNKRTRMVKLVSFLSDYGDSSIKKKRKLQQTIAMPEDDEETVAFRTRICEIIEANGPMTNREIIQAVGKYQEDQKVYRAIKYLGTRGIIKRDTANDNKNIPGDNWEERQSI